MLNTPLLCCEVAVPGRTSAPYGRPTARRAVTAAVIAAAALLLAANAGPARAADLQSPHEGGPGPGIHSEVCRVGLL
ncbi:hypothetical protein ACIP4Y_22405 [Streptomyces sp. NPDC088810]|uniref:hypothetical protein n=1 Tax=Streptomyces sp. NPDC088810 TaxID=3365904 RepID=UPI00380C84A7